MADQLRALDRTARLIQGDFFPSLCLDDITQALTGYGVTLAADKTTLKSAAARTAIVTTFIAVAQLGVRIRLDVPDGVSGSKQPPLPSGDLTASLLRHGGQLITSPTQEGPTDCTITLGEPATSDTIAIAGNEWQARLDFGRPAGGWTGNLPFGGLLAAALASAEVLRRILRHLAQFHSLTPATVRLEGRPASIEVPALDLSRHLDLGDVDFVSAGAITHAALSALLRLDGLRGKLRIFDDDTYDASNLNRYSLLSRPMLGLPKPAPLTNYSRDGLEITGIPARIHETTVGRFGPLAQRVCVGVDDIPARWFIQRVVPDWVGVGATTHLFAMASGHPKGQPCSGCLHPRDDAAPIVEIPTISFVSLLGGVLLAHRLVEECATQQTRAESTQVLDATNLASTQAVRTRAVPWNPDCPLQCTTAAR